MMTILFQVKETETGFSGELTMPNLIGDTTESTPFEREVCDEVAGVINVKMEEIRKRLNEAGIIKSSTFIEHDYGSNTDTPKDRG